MEIETEAGSIKREDLISLEEAACIVGLSARQFRKLVADYMAPQPDKFNRATLYRRGEVVEYKNARDLLKTLIAFQKEEKIRKEEELSSVERRVRNYARDLINARGRELGIRANLFVKICSPQYKKSINELGSVKKFRNPYAITEAQAIKEHNETSEFHRKHNIKL